jgi:hypothetical protein
LDLVLFSCILYQIYRQQNKKTDKLDFIKVKKFYTAKDTMNNEKATQSGKNICKSFIW